MALSTVQLREEWKEYECRQNAMTVISFGPDRIRVAPPTVDAFHALASVLQAHGYQIRVDDTDSYNCREIKGGSGRSLHSYGIAVDVNWDTNPFKETPGGRPVRYSEKRTQHERGQDVKLGIADTDMTPEMIKDALAIKTKTGKTVFEWGGNWNDRKDAMHFEIDVTPEDLRAGIDESTVKRLPSGRAIERPNDLVIETSRLLTIGARGEDVRQLQSTLHRLSFPVGEIDGIYGPMTAEAVRQFQAAHGLAQTGSADEATLRALASATTPARQGEGTIMKPDDLLRIIFGALLGKPAAGAPTPPGAPATPPASQDILRLVLGALLGRAGEAAQPAPPAPGAPAPAAPPVLSGIDKLLGGEALAGKKTALAVLAYAVMAILQATGVAGTATGPTATPTGQILTTLIASFGGMGLLAKIDRIIQTLGVVAGKTPAGPK